MTLDSAFRTFLLESRELLEQMENDLLRLETTPGDPALLNSLLSRVHTVKDTAGSFALQPVVDFAQLVESTLNRLRQGELTLDSHLAALLLKCRDHILELVERAPECDEDLARELQELGGVLAGELAALAAAAPATSLSEAAARQQVAREESVRSDAWHISVRFGRDVLRHGMDPMGFIAYLAGLGELLHVETVADGLPAPEAFDPTDCYLGFEIAFRGDVDKSAIEAVFEFVRDDCELRILPPRSRLADYMRLISELPEDDARLGELLVACGALTPHELAHGLAAQRQPQQCNTPLGEVLIGQGAVDAQVVEAALQKQRHDRSRRNQAGPYIRVHAERLDRLINLIGELVIASASTAFSAASSRDSSTAESALELSRLVEEIRDRSLQLRMVPIGETFQRFGRIVRDVASELGKDIALSIDGAETELDKTVVEKIADPLTHLVRNALDHGIEPVEQRLALGKPAQGQVRLNAFHEAGGIVIEVTDDGGGLQKEKILAKAAARGLLPPGQQLSEQQIFDLIFEAGFSTAERITNLSGRGVGLDVVRRDIEALRGTVEVASQEGVGTTFRIRLPLTLAIIDGFLVRLAGDRYVIPLESVVECIELDAARRDQKNSDSHVSLRGEVLPVLNLRDCFGLMGAGSPRENVVVVQQGGAKAGLLVDELLGEHQTVIKPLGPLFRGLKGLGGSTILGDGQVALILDVGSLIQRVCEQEAERIPAA